MDQSRYLLLALCVLLVASPSLAQNPPQNALQNQPQSATPAPAAPAVTIPQYPDTPRGLEKLLGDMMKLAKEGDNQALAAYVKSLTLPNPDDWFNSVFGDDGPRHAAASAPLRSGAGTTFPSTLAMMLKENRTTIEARKFEKSCDQYATEKEYPLLLQRHSPVPLYDARFKDATSESIWSYFAYVDGGFRYVGNLSVNPPPLPKKPGPPQASQPSQPSNSESQPRIRVGGNVQAAKLIHQEAPKYRQDAKDAHIQGTVIIHAVISKDGSIRDAEVVQGVCVLAEPALAAVKHWRYTPTLLLGKPVEVDTTISVIFTLS
jgi:TonB family protein